MKHTFKNRFMRDLAGSWAGRVLRVLLLVSVAFPQSTVFALAIYDGAHRTADSSAIVTTGVQANLKSISYDKSALRINLDRTVPYRVFSLSRPPRVVVELSQTVHGQKPYEAAVNDGVPGPD